MGNLWVISCVWPAADAGVFRGLKEQPQDLGLVDLQLAGVHGFHRLPRRQDFSMGLIKQLRPHGNADPLLPGRQSGPGLEHVQTGTYRLTWIQRERVEEDHTRLEEPQSV